MDEQDCFRIEAAEQFGFDPANDDVAELYTCTEAQLIAFAKACERKGRAEAARLAECRSADYQAHALPGAAALHNLAADLIQANAATDAELAPILEAERQRFLAAHDASKCLNVLPLTQITVPFGDRFDTCPGVIVIPDVGPIRIEPCGYINKTR